MERRELLVGWQGEGKGWSGVPRLGGEWGGGASVGKEPRATLIDRSSGHFQEGRVRPPASPPNSGRKWYVAAGCHGDAAEGDSVSQSVSQSA
ncbi:hypothetical protein E2C01_050012 [Portunus trituberculatus]|uniref:Uncharacterized protein n=1 Tax=Portunus trituberculatus TaxID=210409 RepID=A0A5B7GAY2_PORTR|nr:hypothetical protein [Portunus trituberculatus]